MIENVENTIEWLRLNGLDHFTVSLKDTDNTRVFESDDTVIFEDNVSKFRQVMNLSMGSRFLIKASKKADSKRGNYFEEFKNISALSAPAVNGLAAQPQPQQDVEALIEAGIAKYKREVEFQNLKAELAEYKKIADKKLSIFEKLVENATPYVPQIAGLIIKKFSPGSAPIALAGFENQTQNNFQQTDEIMENSEITFTDEQTDRVEAALQMWAKADPDCIALLEKIAQMAASKDGMYGMAKGMLLK